MIDLRSDLVKPTAAMRRAMAEAETGDELFGEDPTTRALEIHAARLLGKEAALFVPTGTMGNAVAVLAHRCAPDRVLMDVQSHIARREMTPPAVLSTLRPNLFDTADGCPDAEMVRRWCAASTSPSLVCLETTHTLRRGHAVNVERLRAAGEAAHASGASVHLDGARLFNAAVSLGVEPAAIAAAADSVVVSLCKSIGAPAGALLAGTTALIARARDLRLALGGTMRQTGTLAAAGLVALRSDLSFLAADHARARRLARALASFAPLGLRPEAFASNVVVFDTRPLGIGGEEFARRTAAEGVRVATLAPTVVRLTTHRDLTDADLDRAAEVLCRVVKGCLP